jgi:hypothetical protein
MKNFLKFGLLVSSAALVTASILGLVLSLLLKMELGEVIAKMNAAPSLYIFPTIILAEFCFFINDLLALLSRQHERALGFEFSEIRFTQELDNKNTPIPIRAKLQQLYPLSIALTLVGFVLALIGR